MENSARAAVDGPNFRTEQRRPSQHGEFRTDSRRPSRRASQDESDDRNTPLPEFRTDPRRPSRRLSQYQEEERSKLVNELKRTTPPQKRKINWPVMAILPAVVFLVLCIVMGDTPLRMYVVIRTCRTYYENLGPSADAIAVDFFSSVKIPVDPEECKRNDEVLARTAAVFPILQLCEVVPLILLGSVYGYLSDRYGRKPIVLLAICGIVLDRTNIFINAFFDLDILWLCLGKLITGLTGGLLALVSVCLAAIVDLTHPDERSVYIASFQGLGLVSVSLGTILAGYITTLTEGVWVVPFALSALLGTVAVVWVATLMKETHVVDPATVISSDSLVGLVDRYKRTISMFSEVPYGVMIPFFIAILAGSMKGNARTWYTIKRFHWDVFPDAVYGACESITSGLATVIVIPFIEKRVRQRVELYYKSVSPPPASSFPSPNTSPPPRAFNSAPGFPRMRSVSQQSIIAAADGLAVSSSSNATDSTPLLEKTMVHLDPERRKEEVQIGMGQLRIYLVVLQIEHVLFGMTVQPWMIYALLPLTAFGQMLTVPSRTMVAQIIEPDRLGFIQSVLMILEQVINAIAAPLSGFIWGSTVQTFIPTLYFACAIIQLVAFISTFFVSASPSIRRA
ncbi:major facilitator superfamily domain-containing protein [Cladochytrium replicatum]|nr:major facilitator superfamily domain-containing protein [Cladochytrium replicatum]